MQLLLHTPAKIRIVNGEQEFSCTPAAFAGIEPAYPGLPAGATERYWTPAYSYVQGPDLWLSPDPLNCLPFIAQASTYQTVGTIWVHVTLSKTELCVNADPVDTLEFTATFKAAADPQAGTLPITYAWNIRLRHEGGMVFDAFHAVFLNGVCADTYTYKDNTPLGYWSLREEDIDLVQVGGQRYQVKLAQPVTLTFYREL